MSVAVPAHRHGGRKGGPIVHINTEDGRLAGKTLREALLAAGWDPRRQVYLNIFRDPEGDGVGDGRPQVEESVLPQLAALVQLGVPLIGMGRLVQDALRRAGLPHTPLIHPAARGAIRARANYHLHVARVLAPLATRLLAAGT